MKNNQLSKKARGSLLSRWGKPAAIAIAAMLAQNSLSAQTIFANPVGIGVGTIAPGKDLHVNGPIRFNNLAGIGIRVVTADANGDLNTTIIPPGTVAAGTSIGQSLLWDGTAWINNDFLKVPAFTGSPKVFEVGRPEPIDFIRTIHYGGNVATEFTPGTLGLPSGLWMSQGWRTVNNSGPLGENFMGTRTNWQDFAANIGLTDRIGGGAEKDLNIQMQDFTVPAGADLNNRIIFSGVSGFPPTLSVKEYATIIGNGNMGVGIDNPLVKLHVQDGNIAQVSAGTLGPPALGNRWTAMGDRTPFTGGPGIQSTGFRAQWNTSAMNVGLTRDPITGVPHSGLISWQDANAVGTGNTNLIFGARDATNTNFFERMRISWNGDVGIGTAFGSGLPTARLQVEGGNALIAQVSAGTLGPPSGGNRWCAIGDRQPFAGGPGIIGTGLRAQWDEYAANYGLTEDGFTGTIAGLISWQDVNAIGTGNNPLLFGARDATNTNFFERMRITWDGKVGINIPNPNSKLDILGDGTSAATSSFSVTNGGGTNMFYISDDGFVGVNTPTAIIIPGNVALGGSPTPYVPPLSDVLFSVGGTITSGGDVVAGGDVYALSDANVKKDFAKLDQDSWKKILSIQPYSYTFDATKTGSIKPDARLRYGFKAQDVVGTIPELTKTWGGGYVVNYQGFVPFLTAGIQEHEERLNAVEAAVGTANVEGLSTLKADMNRMATENEALRKENKLVVERLAKLEAQLSGICSLPCVQDAINQNKQEGTLDDQPQLFQNEPNPFGSNTTIKYYVPANAKSAQLKVVDNSGKQLATYQLKTGSGQLEISAGTIPAGTYNYSLYINNQVIDTKKMVIINY